MMGLLGLRHWAHCRRAAGYQVGRVYMSRMPSYTTTTTATTSVIPTIDFADLTNREKDVARPLGEAFAQHGFAYIKNHGLEELSTKALDKAREFFSLSQEKKDEIYKVDSYRGYFRFMEEQTNNKDDLKEGVYYFNDELVIPEDTPESVFSDKNLWPRQENVPEFQHVISEYFTRIRALGNEILSGISLSLGHDKDFFKKSFSQPFVQMGLFHYYPAYFCESSIAETPWGVSEHTDYGAMAILLQDDVGGLQAQKTSGDWVDVPPVPGSLVVNIGDMMEIWTNGALRSTRHRVKPSLTNHRFSIALFLDPNLDCTISPISVENALFPVQQIGSKLLQSVKLPLRFGDYALDKYRKNLPIVANKTG